VVVFVVDDLTEIVIEVALETFVLVVFAIEGIIAVTHRSVDAMIGVRVYLISKGGANYLRSEPYRTHTLIHIIILWKVLQTDEMTQ